jgi:maleylacetate reductase
VRVEDLAEQLNALGTKRVLVLAAPSRRFVDRVVGALADFAPRVFAGARVHVPVETVAAAEAELGDADTIVALGGGAAIGLGKALRLAHDVMFVAIPTTYAGSERTNLYGTTEGGAKRTGRDDRVRPDLIVYDVELTRTLPIALTVQSLFNALAHVFSTASTRTARDESFAAAADVIRAAERLVIAPRDEAARELAQRAASDCAIAADRGKPGVQHGLAHLLGGALGIEHASLHAILLPPFLAYVRVHDPDVIARIETAVGRPHIETYLRDLLARSGAPVALSAVGATREAVEAALATRPELPAEIARAAL